MIKESKELAYIIGVYLTDGYIMFRESKEHFRAFCVDTTFKEVSDACNSYLKNIEIANTVKKRGVKTITGKDIYRLYCPDKTLAKYLYTQS